ncbi:MAG: 50S ribosomal protein L2 [Candidatus Nanohaloarchaea archaeon]|nr:50S ribosomal protein L2 [Candidatus Nanohaloarchaea archaeon]
MGRTRSQRRGRGTPTYSSNTHRAKGEVKHGWKERTGRVTDIEHDSARTAPVAEVEFDGETKYILAPEGLSTGDEITISRDAPIEPGNTLPLKQIPEGVPIYNIEMEPGDGGKIARASGTYAFVVAHERDTTQVYMPSKKIKQFNPDCRASIGEVAGGGKRERMFRKAGEKHHLAKARGKLYPKTSAVSMNATDHPFGGSAAPGKPKTVSRNSSPGQKAGSISASRTGRKE